MEGEDASHKIKEIQMARAPPQPAARRAGSRQIISEHAVAPGSGDGLRRRCATEGAESPIEARLALGHLARIRREAPRATFRRGS